MLRALCLTLTFLAVEGPAQPDLGWPKDKIDSATTCLQQYRHDWTTNDTERLLSGTLSKEGVSIVNYGVAATGHPTSLVARVPYSYGVLAPPSGRGRGPRRAIRRGICAGSGRLQPEAQQTP
jgi:hypothetical protein